MKHDPIRRLAAAALTLILSLSLALPVSASWALGTELVDRSVTLAGGVTLTSQSLWSASKSDLRSEHYITYTPGTGVTPVVYSGAYVTSASTLSAAASALQSQGYRVVGGINGGFFNTDGTAVGALMTGGVLRTLDIMNYAKVGFTGDGHVFIDEREPVKTASWQTTTIQYPDPPEPDPEPTPGGSGEDGTAPPEESDPSAESDPPTEDEPPEEPEGIPVVTQHSFALSGFNAYRNNISLGGLYLYNRDFNSRVNKDPGRDCVAVTLTPVSGGEMTMDCSLTFAAERFCDTAAGDVFDGMLAEGRYMLYANVYGGNDSLLAALRALAPGDLVTISVSGAGEQWADAEYGLSGLYPLLRDGEIVPSLPASSNPYTAIGVRDDGTAVFYTIDGRQSGWSVGAAYSQVAQRLQELGCVSAAALDGGGSTTLGATLPGSSSFSVINRPSGGGERRVNNCVLLVVPAGTSILEGGYYPAAATQVVLTGADLALTAAPYDSTGGPSGGSDPGWAAEGGSIAGSGLSAVYTAGTAAGSYPITTAGGSLTVRVTDKLSSLTVNKEGSSASVSSLTLKPEESVDLTASGKWYNLPVAMADENVTWSADPAVGTVDGTGRFTAGERNASGAVTASAGGRTVTIKVTVDTGLPFDDVAADDWFFDEVRYAVDHGLMKGMAPAAFEPNTSTSRAMLVTILYRLEGEPLLSGGTAFTDVADGQWYSEAISWAAANGIVDGYGDGTFRPEQVMSRQEAAAMLYRYASHKGFDVSSSGDLSGFTDVESVQPWALEYIRWAVGTGLITGMTSSTLEPALGASRAQIAAILTRFCQSYPG